MKRDFAHLHVSGQPEGGRKSSVGLCVAEGSTYTRAHDVEPGPGVLG